MKLHPRRIKLIFFLLAYLIVCSTQLHAQYRIIKGKVHDAYAHTPLEYATVSLLRKDSVIIQSVATNKSGEFAIKGSTSKDLILQIQFIGYFRFDTLIVKDETKKEILLPDILLSHSASSLQDVTVTGKKNNSSVQLNKQIIQARQFANAANGTGLDLVQRLQSVTVNTEGNVLLRGSSNFQVLINGKFTNRTPAEVLAQIPANAIESIEMVTTPSASYDAEG
ncbi:peptidase associated/transthyretin-like domain-containing protein [Ferruginibacter profundus]